MSAAEVCLTPLRKGQLGWKGERDGELGSPMRVVSRAERVREHKLLPSEWMPEAVRDKVEVVVYWGWLSVADNEDVCRKEKEKRNVAWPF